MTDRHLTITLQPDWKAGLRSAAKSAKAGTYQGEVLNFETPSQFFGQLTEKRWDIVRAAHEDIGILTELGLLERTDSGGVCCPYTSMHIDMYLKAA